MVDFKKNAKIFADMAKKGGQKAAQVAADVGNKGKNAVSATKDVAVKTKGKVINAIDQDGDGKIDSADIIIMALKVPGVKIDRDEFLKKELFKYCPETVIDDAIRTTPARAGIDDEIITKISEEVIKFERNAVSGISAALGMPGGVAMAATIPADIAQYYGYMLRAAQKLLYLYGFPQIDTSENKLYLDSETVNSLTLCLGVMYGVASANNAVKAVAKALSVGVEKKLLSAALTKGTVYPIVKEVAKWFGKKMTKEVFAGFFKKAIPVVGGIVGGGITFATFAPCCNRLKDVLKDTILSNPDHWETEEEKQLYEKIKNGVVDFDPDEIIVDTEDDEASEIEEETTIDDESE